LDKFAILLKSYSGDIERAVNLVRSFTEFNRDNIPLYISVPKQDRSLFNSRIQAENIKIINDEDVSSGLITEKINSFSIGYINQQIVKLSFWKTGLCENYFCADSDSYFIRDFSVSDFMFNEDTPYTVLIQDKDLAIEPEYQGMWDSRLERLEYIKKRLGVKDRLLKTCHGFGILSSKVLRSFEENYLKANNLSYSDILKESAFEISWYNFWLQKTKIIEIIPIEPLFKTFHYRGQYQNYRQRLITEKDIARSYIGICLNSNWLMNSGSRRYENPSRTNRLFFRIAKNAGRIRRKIRRCGRLDRKGE